MGFEQPRNHASEWYSELTLTRFGMPTNSQGPSLIMQPASPPRLSTHVHYVTRKIKLERYAR